MNYFSEKQKFSIQNIEMLNTFTQKNSKKAKTSFVTGLVSFRCIAQELNKYFYGRLYKRQNSRSVFKSTTKVLD